VWRTLILQALKPLSSALTVPTVADYGVPAWHLFVVRTAERDDLANYLIEQGIQTVIHYPVPPHQQTAYPEFGGLSLPLTELIHSQVISLPMGPSMSPKSVNYVSSAISNFFN
jgi:dTDP-4-amino-4,6-dideoxygalactose transaminase